MQNTKRLSELLTVPGKRLASLNQELKERSAVLLLVKAALPEKLAAAVVTAVIEGGRLTIGVVGSAWASRLRYSTPLLRARVGASSGMVIQQVRIRIVPPGT